MDDELKNKLEEEAKQVNTKRQQLGMLGNRLSLCQHCYCDSGFFNSQEHLICCMCGHRTLKNPITY